MFRCVVRQVLTSAVREVYVSAPEGRDQLGVGRIPFMDFASSVVEPGT